MTEYLAQAFNSEPPEKGDKLFDDLEQRNQHKPDLAVVIS